MNIRLLKKRIENILKKKETWQRISSGKFKVIKNYILDGLGIDSKKAKEVKGKVI